MRRWSYWPSWPDGRGLLDLLADAGGFLLDLTVDQDLLPDADQGGQDDVDRHARREGQREVQEDQVDERLLAEHVRVLAGHDVQLPDVHDQVHDGEQVERIRNREVREPQEAAVELEVADGRPQRDQHRERNEGGETPGRVEVVIPVQLLHFRLHGPLGIHVLAVFVLLLDFLDLGLHDLHAGGGAALGLHQGPHDGAQQDGQDDQHQAPVLNDLVQLLHELHDQQADLTEEVRFEQARQVGVAALVQVDQFVLAAVDFQVAAGRYGRRDQALRAAGQGGVHLRAALREDHQGVCGLSWTESRSTDFLQRGVLDVVDTQGTAALHGGGLRATLRVGLHARVVGFAQTREQDVHAFGAARHLSLQVDLEVTGCSVTVFVTVTPPCV